MVQKSAFIIEGSGSMVLLPQTLGLIIFDSILCCNLT